jgi:hypothetical protein
MISNETVISYDDVFENRPGTVLGYRGNGMPIYNIAGGAIDVTDDDVTDSDDEDGDTDGSTDDTDSDTSDEDWTPPSREDWQKVLDAKKKADSEAAQRKRWLRENGFDPKTGKPIEKPKVALDDDEDDTLPKATKKDDNVDAEDLLRATREKLEKNFQRQLERETVKAETRGRSTAYSLITEVPAALEEAGWNGKNLPRMIKLLDLDSVEIDDDGVDIDALSRQVTELKKDFPEFFKRARMKDAAKEVADTGAVGGGKKKAPASEEDLDWKDRMRLQLQRPNR